MVFLSRNEFMIDEFVSIIRPSWIIYFCLSKEYRIIPLLPLYCSSVHVYVSILVMLFRLNYPINVYGRIFLMKVTHFFRA